VQCDIDIIGDASPLAEAELLNASLDALNAIGLSDARIRVNHRALLLANIAALGVAEADAVSAMITVDKLDKLGASGVAAELATKFGDAVAAAGAAWLGSLNADAPAPAELSWLLSVVSARHPGRLRFDPTLVRGMGYYTGSIFEIEHPGSGSSIGGGGRYDGMVGRWLGQDVPAVGISIGFERAVDLVPDDQFGSVDQALVLVLDSGDAAGGCECSGIAGRGHCRGVFRSS